MYEMNEEFTEERIYVNFKETIIADILDSLLKNKNYKWSIRNNIIRIEKELWSQKLKSASK